MTRPDPAFLGALDRAEMGSIPCLRRVLAGG
jgi:hypothetical protein